MHSPPLPLLRMCMAVECHYNEQAARPQKRGLSSSEARAWTRVTIHLLLNEKLTVHVACLQRDHLP